LTHLKRYTELPYVLQVLQTRQLTLVNPNSWDDKNDSHFVQTFKEKNGFGSVLALCLTEAGQTYHHWRIFTQGASGACLFFDKEKLLSWINETGLITGREVKYQTLQKIRNKTPQVNDLPFLKRKAYEHEAEFRLLYSTKAKSVPFKSFDFPIEIIEGIYLNPWLPSATVNAIKQIIHKMDGFEKLEVLRATIITNDEWKQVATTAGSALI
jgi:hypothetical protein